MSTLFELNGAALARLGVLQATNASGAVVARLDVTHWPVTVGRALSADLVLSDIHVAPTHLRIDRRDDGRLEVLVLDTVNGVQLGRDVADAHYARGTQFEWSANAANAADLADTAARPALRLGTLQLALRLADDPLADELPLHAVAASAAAPHAAQPVPPSRFAAAPALWTTLAVVGVLLAVWAQAWLEITEPSQLEKQLPGQLGLVLVSLAVWAGVWALATKLFMGRLQFWRHVRIASAGFLASGAVALVASVLAFALSLEALARFEIQLSMLCLAVLVYWHLAVIAPQRTRFLAWLVGGLAVLGLVASLGTNWLQTQRLSSKLYMSHVYPPSWRIAKGVGIEQFMGETAQLKQKLDKRLKDRSAEGDSGDDVGDD